MVHGRLPRLPHTLGGSSLAALMGMSDMLRELIGGMQEIAGMFARMTAS
jgi:hypothetical protein